LRFDRLYIPNFEQFLFILAGPAIALPIFITMGLYRAILRYMTGDTIWTILKAVTLSTMAWVSLVYITLPFGPGGSPPTIAVVYWLGSFAALVASRFAVKWLMNGRTTASTAAKRVLIYGAGEPAIELANSLRATAQFEV